jgi:predicted DNA-binding protein
METSAYSGKKEKVNFLFPSELNNKANAVAKELGFTYSDFVRQAVADFIERIERNKIDREIEEACKQFYDMDKQLAEEWRVAESRV